jgi:DNA repair protein RadC
MEDRFARTDQLAVLRLDIVKVEKLPQGSRSVAKLCQDWGLGKEPQEVLWVIAYDLNSNIRTVVEVARGGHSELYVHIPSVLTAVLATGAIAFTLAHNHPAISVVPSVSDHDLSLKVMEAANTVGLIYEEHIIVGPTDEYFSFVDAGLIIAGPRGGGKPVNLKRAAAAARSGK